MWTTVHVPVPDCRVADDPPHRAAAFNSLHVSCLAQTQEPAPVILYSPECVYGAATADSQLSFLGHRRR